MDDMATIFHLKKLLRLNLFKKVILYFQFRHYMSILSAVKLVQPHKLMFHYHMLPLMTEKSEW